MDSWQAVIIADLHLKSSDPYGVKGASGGLDSRTLKRLELLDQAVDHAIREQVDCFVILGDLFNRRSIAEAVRVQVVNRLKRLIQTVSHVLYIVGNHELHNGSAPLQSEGVFAGRLEVVTEPTILSHIAPIPLFCAPDVGKKQLEEWLRTVYCSQAKGNLLLGHFPVVGGYVNDNMVSKRGVARELLDRFSVVLLGDYHKRQLFEGSVGEGVSDDNFLRGYVGSLARNSFAEEGQSKSFLWLKLTEALHRGWEEFRYETRIIRVEDTPFVTFVIQEPDTFDSIQGKLPDVSGAIVRLRICGSTEWFANLRVASIVECCYQQGAQVVKVDPKVQKGKSDVPIGDSPIPDLNVFDVVKACAEDQGTSYQAGLQFIGDALDKVGG